MKLPISGVLFATAVALILPACESTRTGEPPPPKTGVKVLSDDSIVDVDTDRTKVHVGEKGVRVNTPGTNIDIGDHGVRVLSD